MCYAEIHLRTLERDLHSGTYGGVEPNALEALCRLLMDLKGVDGRIHIRGLYDQFDKSGYKPHTIASAIEISRPVAKNWTATVSTPTARSMAAKMRVRTAGSSEAAATMLACWKYRNVPATESSVTQSAIPAR